MADHFVLACNPPVWPTQANVKLALVEEAGHVLFFVSFPNYYLVQVYGQFWERCVQVVV